MVGGERIDDEALRMREGGFSPCNLFCMGGAVGLLPRGSECLPDGRKGLQREQGRSAARALRLLWHLDCPCLLFVIDPF